MDTRLVLKMASDSGGFPLFFSRAFLYYASIMPVEDEMERSSGTILLIDDDPFFLRILSDNFRECGFTVFTANDGIEGVQAYLKHYPEVVISDLIMPRMGGVSTCMEITRCAGVRNPVVILLTSMFQGAAHEHETAEMGAKVHIPKSTKPLDIVIIVEQLLERRRNRQPADS